MPEGQRFLAEKGFGPTAIVEFGGYPVEVLREEYARRSALGQQQGAMVAAWRLVPPGTAGAGDEAPRRRVTDTIFFTTAITPQERDTWVRRFRSAPATERPAIVERFEREYAELVDQARRVS